MSGGGCPPQSKSHGSSGLQALGRAENSIEPASLEHSGDVLRGNASVQLYRGRLCSMNWFVAVSQGPPPSGLDELRTSTLSEDCSNEWCSRFKDSRLPECEGNATTSWVTQSVRPLHTFELFLPELNEDARQDDGISPWDITWQGDPLMLERCVDLLLCHRNDAKFILGQNGVLLIQGRACSKWARKTPED